MKCGVVRAVVYCGCDLLVTMSVGKGGMIMSTTITGVVTNGVVVPSSPLPEGAQVEIYLNATADVPPNVKGEVLPTNTV